jgi:hypothetical protein
MTGKAVPVYSGKNPGPKTLAAWAEQERQDAKEAEYWGNISAIEIDLDTLDMTPKPALSPDHPDYKARARENAKLVDLAEWRESARERAAYQNSPEYEERERQIAEELEWCALTEKLVIVYDDGDDAELFEDTLARDMLLEIRRELVMLDRPEVVAERNAHIRATNKTGKMIREEIGADGKAVRKTVEVSIRREISVEKCLDDLAAFDHHTRADGVDSDLIEAAIAPLLDMARVHVKGDVLDAFRAARDAYAAELAAPKQRKASSKDDRPAVYRAIDSLKLSRQIGRDDLYQKVFALASKYPLSEESGAQSDLKGKIATETSWDKRAAAKLIAEAIKNAKAAKPAPKRKKGDRPVCDLSELGHRAASDGAYKVMTDQGDKPRRFQNGGRLAEVREDESGNIRITAIDKPRLKGAHLEEEIDFMRDGGNVSAPDSLVNRVFNMPLAKYPPLYRITSFPTYSAEMALVMDPGYHAGSGLYHQPKRGVAIPPVPEIPTEEEVKAARDDLVDLFADFPMDGLTRVEIEAAISNGDPVPSLANALSVALTPIMRDAIDGPTPNHLATKDKPRTGATLLWSAMSTVGTLEPAAPQSLPESRAEVQKTLVSIFDSGEPYAAFDNIPEGETTESDEVAGAMTAFPEYTGRRLGETGMVKARVTQTWLTTGIRTQLSEQLRERTLLIELDPKMERPGDRPTESFKYAPLIPHIQANAGRYMHALLVLVQNWKAKDCPKWKGQPLGGFEDHARKIGGILDAAGIHGFMGNRDALRARMEVSDSPETELLDSMIAAHHATPKTYGGTLFRASGDERPPVMVDDKPFEYANYRVLSIIGLLEAHNITPAKWGYDFDKDGDVIYPAKSLKKVGYHFGAMAGTVREWHEAQTDIKDRQKRYVLTKMHRDQYGWLYGLEVLPLVG